MEDQATQEMDDNEVEEELVKLKQRQKKEEQTKTLKRKTNQISSNANEEVNGKKQKQTKNKEPVIENKQQEEDDDQATQEFGSNELATLLKANTSNIANETKEEAKKVEVKQEEMKVRSIRDSEFITIQSFKAKQKPTFPSDYEDIWDNYHVKIPCSPQNKFKQKKTGRMLGKWYQIHSVLSVPIHNSIELEEAISEINSDCDDFGGMHHVLNEVLTEQQTKTFFSVTLPQMIHLALSLLELIKKPIPLLLPNSDAVVTLTQMQIASILANAFFCTFPRQGGSISVPADSPLTSSSQDNSQKDGDKEGQRSIKIQFPNINFFNLYTGSGPEGISLPSQVAKLQCILNYFERVCAKFVGEVSKDQGTKISVYRKSLQMSPDWAASTKTFTQTTVSDEGLIEDTVEPHIEMDFANKMIGGGVLGRGCIQEEIRFLISPELIVSLLFTAKIENNEVVVIRGPERFSKYSGYSYTFEWNGDYRDKSAIDSKGYRNVTVVAMDALQFGIPSTQYTLANIEREVNKAYLAFTVDNASNLPIATGNWGCGAFNGYHDLKAVIQLLAAAEAEKNLTYLTFGVKGLAPSLRELCFVLRQKKVTVGAVWQALIEISTEYTQLEQHSQQDIPVPQVFNLLIDKFE